MDRDKILTMNFIVLMFLGGSCQFTSSDGMQEVFLQLK